MMVGWTFLQTVAAFLRDSPLPTPSAHYQGLRGAVMKFETGFALKKRVLSSRMSLERQDTQFWLPHAGRSYLRVRPRFSRTRK